jgi:hypothetical protein
MNDNNLEDDFEGEDWQKPLTGPIAKAFYPFDSKERFTTCTMCQVVLDDNSEYIIEKARKGTDVIFELAMCLSCANKMRNQLSAGSKERIETYMMEHTDFEARAQHFLDNPSDNMEDYIGHCVVTGKPIDPREEHQIYAYCTGNEMIYSAMPYAISGEIMEIIQEMLSPETKQEMDDFMDQYLIPDDLRDLLKGRPVFV